ncbi:ATP-binding protein [Dyadobacter fanqingshengii]|uniref:histidine kinase n=1 Tax=Dyadobacter fanqingshengii TaxID=2906443 RepID=A0A9X1PAZ8_9BACT|nr:ATP-binding protein [Dyadobacter fanqingshengii]MCF0040140.1 ATP-binding protein [Dyadobacter fanqingshengii]MCF2502371.1 ATP-binding protein [Dyadobacter fanqingshengii]USJ38108.1 ATP-binding protein [Dyadobacter fanqingshengii]
MNRQKTYEELLKENDELHQQLEEATDTIQAIRSGQVDALVVKNPDGGHQLFTLKTADQTYRVFIEKMNEGAVTLNYEGLILYCNSMFASMINMPLSRVLGLHFSDFIAEGFQAIYQDLFNNGWKEDSKTELCITRGSELVPCQLSVTMLQLDEGPALSIILTDLSFQKEIQQLLKLNNLRLAEINAELEASNHDLQQFASIASHDLQEPLRKILIFSTMLRNKLLHELSDENVTYLDKIIASSQRMRNMITDILSYSRLSTNLNNFAVTSLNEVIDEVLEDYEILILEKKAEIVVDKLPDVEVNRGQIKQVFQNLISNSIKFSKPGLAPVIRISGGMHEDSDASLKDPTEPKNCFITVSDNGIGFDELYYEKIFSLFERLNTKDKYEGSGIGLAITKKIIDKHNGSISVSSKEGEGAAFELTLPVSQNSEQP